MFKELENKTGIEAVVVTINSIRDYGTGDTTIESFATNLFNIWGIGHKRENNGVLILVAVKDRKCRIELGAGYGRRYDSLMKQVIDTNMIPYFKADDYSRGIYEGARAVIEKVTKRVSWFSFYKWHISIGILIVVCIFAGISCMRSGKGGWGWAFFATVGMLLLFLFFYFFFFYLGCCQKREVSAVLEVVVLLVGVPVGVGSYHLTWFVQGVIIKK